jgi:hypothetical protein
LLVLAEGESEGSKYRLEIGDEFFPGLFFERGESAAAGFLYSLVGVEYGLEQLYDVSRIRRADKSLTPSMVGKKMMDLSSGAA